MITMPELFDALDVITDHGCFKLDVLLIQTCLGCNLEFRYHMRQFCQYYVSYADCGLIGDILFNQTLAAVVANPLMTAKQFAKTVVEHFTPVQTDLIYQAFGATDETKLDDLAGSVSVLATFFIENGETYNDDIGSALEVTRKYGLQFNIDYYVDLKDFLEHLTISDTVYI